MKLAVLLTLAALPAGCHAGAGCQVMQDLIDQAFSPAVSVSEYMQAVQPFTCTDLAKNAVEKAKQCFLNQSNETQANVQVMMNTIYASVYCKGY